MFATTAKVSYSRQRFGLLLLPAVLLTVPAWAQSFGPITTYTTSTVRGPYDVKVGDVNGDGLPDIVTAETQAGVGVLLAMPGGGFGPVTNYAVSASTAWNGGADNVVLGDVTADGRPDILVTSNSLGSVVVLIGLAGGGFGPYMAYPLRAGSYIRGLALGDVNGDGLPDVVAASHNDHAVAVVLGQASGGFGPPVLYTTGPNSSPEGVALGDVNGDGRLDIAASCNNGSTAIGAAVLLAQPAGGFGPPITYHFAANPRKVALGDVSGDGLLDLVVDGAGFQQVGVLLGQTGGGFGPVARYPTGGGGLGFTLGDVDNDGLLDVVVANTNTNSLGVLPGQVGGILGPLAVYSTGYYSTIGPISPYAVAVSDVNGDGRPDLVAACANSSKIAVLLAVNPIPNLIGMLPAVGAVGSRLALTGTDLTGTQLIRFAGSSSNTVSTGFVVNAAGTQISDIMVPSGAVTGPITVQKAGGVATTAGFFTVQNVTATLTSSWAEGMQVVPNPAHCRATLQLPAIPGATTATLTVLDVLGRARYTQIVATSSTTELDLTGLAPGLYAVRVAGGISSTTQRLVVE